MGAADRIVQAQDGVADLRLDSLDHLWELTGHFAQDPGFVFRGHASSEWSLETTLERHLRRIGCEPPYPADAYARHYWNFLRTLRGRVPCTPPAEGFDDAIWALGQHHGLATPLLDWTHSIYVALYFAFADDAPPATGECAVWALHTEGFRAQMDLHNHGKDYEAQFAFVDPYTDQNPRLLSQAAIFTRQPLGFDLAQWAREHFAGERLTYLYRIQLPFSERLRALAHLRLMNISGASVFPDLLGASLASNEWLELTYRPGPREAASWPARYPVPAPTRASTTAHE